MDAFLKWVKDIWDYDTFLRDQTFWKGILVAAVVAVIWKAGQWLWNASLYIWHSRSHFDDVSGTWVGTCVLPSYQGEYIEIWRYRRSGDQVRLVFYSYGPGNPKIHKWYGGGVYRGTKLSAYYFERDRSTYESGVVALELMGLRTLKGVYAQFDPRRRREPMYVSKRDYIQTRITLPFECRVRMLFGWPPVRTFDDVKRIHQEATAKPAAPRIQRPSRRAMKASRSNR